MVDLSKNTNPYYPTKKMIHFLQNNIYKINSYPTCDSEEIIKKIATAFTVNEKNVFISLGTLESMNIILKLLNKKTIGIFVPTFWGIKFFAKKNNYKIIETRLTNNLNYDLKAINAIAKKVDIIYICNSNNPTLDVIDRKDIINLVTENSHCHFIVDETMLSFDVNYQNKSVVLEAGKFSNLSVLLSCSKILGIAGLRVGFLFSNADLINRIKFNNTIYRNNILTNLFLENYCQEVLNMSKTNQKIKIIFDYFEKSLNKHYIKEVIKNNGPFILIEFKANYKSFDIVNYLKKNNILISNITEVYSELKGNWVRISAGKRREMKRLAFLINKYCTSVNKTM